MPVVPGAFAVQATRRCPGLQLAGCVAPVSRDFEADIEHQRYADERQDGFDNLDDEHACLRRLVGEGTRRNSSGAQP